MLWDDFRVSGQFGGFLRVPQEYATHVKHCGESEWLPMAAYELKSHAKSKTGVAYLKNVQSLRAPNHGDIHSITRGKPPPTCLPAQVAGLGEHFPSNR